MKILSRLSLACLLILVMASACTDTGASTNSTAGSTATAFQTTASHSDETEPDYDVVFPDGKVNEIVISISADNWEAVIEDMTSKYGEFGSGGGMGGGGGGGGQPGDFGGNRPQTDNPEASPQTEGVPDTDNRPQNIQTPSSGTPEAGRGQADQDFTPPGNAGEDRPEMDNAQKPGQDDQNMQDRAGMGRAGMGGGGMMDGDDDENPVWVDATIEFNGESWEHVGFRLKGNSSLRSSWSSGSYKLPFKLDFDEFEDSYEETKNQRFYGFKQITFSSNFSDSSYLKETLAADIFRAAGVPSSQTAFYAVYVDHGEGPLYLGLYTAVEVVDDTLIQTQFEDDSGNVYKPSGSAATFAAGTFDEEQYDKETNQKEADYGDVEALLETLNSDLRLSDSQAWRAELESVFDVDEFLQWLAVNSVMQNWDTYGSMSHNYYLYHDPVSDQLVWIPWDNNQSFSSRGGGGMGGGGRTPADTGTSTSIGNENVGDNWPLISYLLADEVYQQKYVECVEDVISTAFNPDTLEAVINDLHDLIAAYVENEEEGYTTLDNNDAFDSSADTLITHINERYQAALDYLADQDK